MRKSTYIGSTSIGRLLVCLSADLASWLSVDLASCCGGRGSCSSYLEDEESDGDGSSVSRSSRSGTIVSTAYTSSVSRPSPSTTVSSVEAAVMLLDSLGIHGDDDVDGNHLDDCLRSLAQAISFISWDPSGTEEELLPTTDRRPPYRKLFNQLMVHGALSGAYNKILTLPDSSPSSVEAQRIEHEMATLLSTYKSKAGEAIRSTMEKIRTKLLLEEDGDGSSTSQDPQQGSSGIHKATRSLMTYIDFLVGRNSLVNAAIQGHLPYYTENVEPLDSIIFEMVSSLEEKPVNISESFSDQGHKFLFLLNNSHHIQQSLQFYYPSAGRPVSSLADDLTRKIEGYTERYLHASWTSLLSCLFNPIPLCLGKNCSVMSMFESEFQKIYSTQMEWKVPNPELKRRLREVITDKIIPGYTKYIEDNKVTDPKISPQELEAMLQELFEG